MINLSANLVTRYNTFLTENGIETNRHHLYMKWLRYYLDFCTKYSFEWSQTDSLSAFLIKLQNKNQQPFMRDQAKTAVGLFWKLEKTQKIHQQKDEFPRKGARKAGCVDFTKRLWMMIWRRARDSNPQGLFTRQISSLLHYHYANPPSMTMAGTE
jgi:hypothetical protein